MHVESAEIFWGSSGRKVKICEADNKGFDQRKIAIAAISRLNQR
jgi:hypothetical protein